MTAVFEKHHIQFMYPENWTLVENEETDEFVEVSLESPEGSIWSVSIFPGDSEQQALIENCSLALSEQYQDFERVEYEGQLDGHAARGFDAHFYCLDFLVTAATRVFASNDQCVIIYYQAESREFDKLESVFDAITLSLIRSLT